MPYIGITLWVIFWVLTMLATYRAGHGINAARMTKTKDAYEATLNARELTLQDLRAEVAGLKFANQALYDRATGMESELHDLISARNASTALVNYLRRQLDENRAKMNTSTSPIIP